MATRNGILQNTSIVILPYTSCQVLVNHPDLKSAQKNRDYVMSQVTSAVATIAGVAQAGGHSQKHPYEEVGYLAGALEEFSVSRCVCVSVCVCSSLGRKLTYFLLLLLFP